MIKNQIEEFRELKNGGHISKNLIGFWILAVLVVGILAWLPSQSDDHQKTQSAIKKSEENTSTGREAAVDTLLKELKIIKQKQNELLKEVKKEEKKKSSKKGW